MLHVKKILILVFCILLIGGGAFAFFTRQPKTPSNSIQEPLTEEIQEVEQSDTQQPTQVELPAQQSSSQSQPIPLKESPKKEETSIKEIPPNIVRFAIDTSASESSFTIDEVLRGEPFTVVGTTHDVSGDVMVDFSDPSRSALGTIRIDARTLRTDNSNRDGAIKRFILHSEDAGKEFITFTPTKISGLPKAFAAGIPLNLTITGDLTISGITRSASFAASNVSISPDSIIGDARSTIKRSDYGLIIPSIPFVANVPDEFTIALRLKANSQLLPE